MNLNRYNKNGKIYNYIGSTQQKSGILFNIPLNILN